jgi:hypothetical protein
MRNVLALGSVLAVLAAACDGGAGVSTGPARAAGPLFEASADAPTVTILSQRYQSQDETFPLCDGSVATGTINWNEDDTRLDYPDGSVRYRVHLNMVGGRAVGPDGTEYVLHQVNQFQSTFESASNIFDSQQTVLIAAISPGSGDDLFFEDVSVVHFDPVNGFSSSDTVTVECHG